MRRIGGSLGCYSSDDTTILQTFLSAPACNACTDMVYSKALERDFTTIAMTKAMLGLKFGIFSFTEHDRFDFFTSEGHIRAVMHRPREKCSCSELKLVKHLHTFFVLT